jgi:hypothetical protein
MTEKDPEDITKEWSNDLRIPTNTTEIFDIDSPETAQDTPGPSKTNKIKEVQGLDSASMNTSSISPEQGRDGEELDDKEVENKQGDEVDPLKKRKGSPLKPSSWKKSKASMTKI